MRVDARHRAAGRVSASDNGHVCRRRHAGHQRPAQCTHEGDCPRTGRFRSRAMPTNSCCSATHRVRVQGHGPHGLRRHQPGGLHFHQGGEDGNRRPDRAGYRHRDIHSRQAYDRRLVPASRGYPIVTTQEIVPPTEYQRQITVTSVGGDTLVISDQPSVLTRVTVLEPEG